MIAHLENYFPQQQELSHDVKGIIVLGGSFDRSLSVSRDTSVFNMAGGRLIQAVALAKKYPHLPIVFTGAGVAIKNAKSEAHMAKDYFDAFGIDNQKIIYETESKDTIENASKSYALVKPQAGDRWALVTSAIHMPRSVGLFEAQGWSILPYPVDYHSDGRFPYFQTPNLKKNFMIWAAAMKEWAGLISNRLYHITPSVLPALK